jgi:hypothetical protein
MIFKNDEEKALWVDVAQNLITRERFPIAFDVVNYSDQIVEEFRKRSTPTTGGQAVVRELFPKGS